MHTLSFNSTRVTIQMALLISNDNTALSIDEGHIDAPRRVHNAVAMADRMTGR